MNLFGVDNWLRTPADRDVIARWTTGGAPPDDESPEEQALRHRLDLPQPPDPERWEFLALGDTGRLRRGRPGPVAAGRGGRAAGRRRRPAR
jgi:hypothetical protein